MEEEKLWELDRDNRVWWGKSNNNSPRIKKFLDEAKEGGCPINLVGAQIRWDKFRRKN
jgi:hypothetical protein